MEKYEKPTPYRISTITATGSVGTSINLDVLYNCLEVITIDENNDHGIVYVEYGKKKSETIFKGYTKKFSINRRKEKPSKRFDNQVTIVYKTPENTNLNIKTFRNGNVQITGIKTIEQGYRTIDNIINILRDLYEKDNSVIGDLSELKNMNYKICLINTDYKVGFPIKRENLHKILKNDYGNISNYEPVIYPGVKIHYYFNKMNVLKDGLCHCSKCCYDSKSGDGSSDTNCKKITIAVFQSGCIIITGSQTIEQVDECYEFINDILYNNIDKIEKKMLVPIDNEEGKTKKIIKILKSSIQF